MSAEGLPLETFLGFDVEIDATEETKERFKITDLGQASWALRKIRYEKERINEIQDLAQKEIEKIETWCDTETGRHTKQIEFFVNLLVEYHMSEFYKDPKRKTISLPEGKLTARQLPDKWEYNEETAIKWFKENKPEYIRLKEEIDKKAIKKKLIVADGVVVTEGGEVVEGVSVVEQGIKFDVKVEV